MFSGANPINITLDTINDIEPFHLPTAVKIYKQRAPISNPHLLWIVFLLLFLLGLQSLSILEIFRGWMQSFLRTAWIADPFSSMVTKELFRVI
tara:strand:- start:69 stop:347 length:279 start_codon:yes stop_codon:yes gene_type:complete